MTRSMSIVPVIKTKNKLIASVVINHILYANQTLGAHSGAFCTFWRLALASERRLETNRAMLAPKKEPK